MAYDFVPKSLEELFKNKKMASWAVTDASILFSFLRDKDKTIPDPIAIDVTKNAVKILPAFEKKINLATVKNKNKLKIKMDFGRGSRGITNLSSDKVPSKDKEEGGGNKGIAFEREFVKALNTHFKGEKVTNTKYQKCISDISKDYNLSDKDVQIIPEGELNKRRPVVFSGNRIFVGGSNFDIGATVTDITLKTMDNKKRTDYVYLSLKYGPKVTFFNAGVGKVLPKTELESGHLKNEQGLMLLSLFGINPAAFCSVFDPTQKTAIKGLVDTFAKVDKGAIQDLIKSGVGYGYHLVHMASNGSIHDVKMTNSELNHSSTPLSCKILYGGTSGLAKRVDVLVETPLFKLIFNFRNKARGGVFPSHLMCDYTIKH